MRRALNLLAIGLVLTASATAACASDGVSVALNGSRRLLIKGVVANVVVGDPKVADVTVIDTHSVILTGRGYGSTELIVTDARGRELMDSLVTVASPDVSRLTIYRGLAADNYGCAGLRCHYVDSEGSGSTGAHSGGDTGPPMAGIADQAAGLAAPVAPMMPHP